MALLLCIETATEVCSIAIAKDDRLLSLHTLENGLKHSAALTTLIDKGFHQAGYNIKELSAVAISDGPGSYTGLRVGAGTAKGICFALDIPLIAIPTLKTLIVDTTLPVAVLPTIDARRMEVYAAVYRQGELVKGVHSLIWTQESLNILSKEYNSLVICGNGAEKAADLIKDFDNIALSPTRCNAASMVPLAFQDYCSDSFVSVAYHDPMYFKSPNITKPKRII